MATRSSSLPSLLTAWSSGAYCLLVLVRIFVGAILPGYVHPDEFFQGGQDLFFGCSSFQAWEFQPENALRSILPPTLMTWLPLHILCGGESGAAGGAETLMTPRLFCGLLSVLLVDVPLYFMTRTSATTADANKGQQQQRQPTTAMWVFTTSWPAWVIINRPFSNGLETMWLSVLLYLVHSDAPVNTVPLLLGVVCALGLFTRFTFIFFAFPVMILYLVKQFKTPDKKLLLTLLYLTSGFVATFVLIVYADASYYHGTQDASERSSQYWMLSYITPLNAILYNSQVDNLKDHGLHPRWTHSIVNMHLLFGPMALLFYGNQVLSRRSDTTGNRLHQGCTWTIISGLTLLSLAPHQEPRFLTPLVVPLAILTGSCVQTLLGRRRLYFWAVWFGFNVILLMLFGVLHQGGVVPTLLKSSGSDNIDTTFFLHTYMPPTFLTRRRSDCSKGGDAVCRSPCSAVSDIVDFGGINSSEEFLDTLQQYCQQKDGHDNNIHIVTSPLILQGVSDVIIFGTYDCRVGLHSCHVFSRQWPHLTTEDFPNPFESSSFLDFMQQFQLITYEVTCRNVLGDGLQIDVD